jgi:hypothetical protein
MRKDRPCPVGGCRQRYQTVRGMVRHHQRVHARPGRWRGRAVLPDGGRDRKRDRDRLVASVLAGDRPSDQLREAIMEDQR